MSASAIDAGDVRDAARGNWLYIIRNLAPDIDKAVEKPGRHIACPVHGGKDGFRLFKDADYSGGGICNTCGAKTDGFSLLMWKQGWSFPETLMAVADVLGLSTGNEKSVIQAPITPVIAKPKPIQDGSRTRSFFRKIWKQSMSIRHPDAEPARRYLQFRGLDDSIPDWPSVRFHPNMQYRDEDGKVIGYYPAILLLVEKGNEAVTIHRIFLTSDGHKAPVSDPKKMMAIPADRVLMGGAVRLGTPGRVLSVAEGFETALAILEATGMVTWMLVNSTLMAGFDIPVGVEKLIIWSDLDLPSPKTGIRPGTEAAEALAARAIAQSVEVEIREPIGPIPEGAKSEDWLNVLNKSGPNAFALRSCSYSLGGGL